MPRIEAKAGAGSVALVGAGPGDPELLTLKAVRVLQSADVVLFDALVSDGVLDLVRREARCLAVGKRGGRASCRQQDINDLMVKLARRGKRVVRLKAGDPTIFGRAGEEISQLAAAGIPFEIVPGVTAGLAAAAALGISLTHRDRAHSVRFVTGHSKNGGLPDDLDWRGLADAETSLVFYMAGRTGPAAARRLMAEELPASTPVVIMASVSRPDEERWSGTLAALGAGECPIGCDRPALLCIGQVFAQTAVAVNGETLRMGTG